MKDINIRKILMAMGLTRMRLRTFYWVSQIGMLPGTAIYVNAGSQLGQIKSISGILSPSLLISLALLGVFPLVAGKLLNLYRNKANCPENKINTPFSSIPAGKRLTAELHTVLENCNACGSCRSYCGFLQKHGLPKNIAETYDPVSKARLAFECSLCGLCGAVCPEKLIPVNLFLEMRRDAVAGEQIDFSGYKQILGYEKRGNSSLFSYYGFPEGCDTVFFPGCTLPGTRPDSTWRIFELLKKQMPNLGIVLDCCNKISHDLGRQMYFEAMFMEMHQYLSLNGIGKVLVACPNCYIIFKTYGKNIKVEMIYEHLKQIDLPDNTAAFGEVVVHDSCPLRMEVGTQDDVRDLAYKLGFSVKKMKHERRWSICCGEGGSVSSVNPEFARRWVQQRKMESNGLPVMTYCAGCAGFIGRETRTFHIADALIAPKDCISGNIKVVKAPFTYLERLKLKRRFKKRLHAAVSRTRTYCPDKIVRAEKDAYTLAPCKSSLYKKGFILSVVLVAAISIFFAVRHFMYVLDSYVYTAEFHTMFMVSNIKNNNISLLSEYFRALGPIGGMPNLLLAHAIQIVAAPLTGTTLPVATQSAFGIVTSFIVNFVCYYLISLLAYGLGKFFFGDILSAIHKTKAPLSPWITLLLGILISVPAVPVAYVAAVGGITRVRIKQMTGMIGIALSIRLCWIIISASG